VGGAEMNLNFDLQVFAQSGSSRVFYSPNKTALGAPGDATSIIVRGQGKKQIIKVYLSYIDTNYNAATGYQGAYPVWGRVVVMPSDFRIDQAFGAGAASAPNVGTDFTPYGPVVFDMVTSSPTNLFDFTDGSKDINEGRILSQGDGPLTIIACAAQIPAAAQLTWTPRLHVLWRNVYDDLASTPYSHGVNKDALG
jgi:hypothetical protein